MKSTYSQVNENDLLEGNYTSVALLKLMPGELSKRYKLNFNVVLGDLDYADEAILSFPSGKQCILFRYHNYPFKGTEVLLDSNSSTLKDDLNEVLKILKLPKESIEWTIV